MMLELYSEDVAEEFQSVPTSAVAFKHFKPVVQGLVVIVHAAGGKSKYWTYDRTNYNAVFPE